MAQRYNCPLSTGVMRSISKSFRRLHLESEAVQRSRPYGSSLPSQYNASCAGRESRALACQHKPLSDFTVAVEQALKWLTSAKQLKWQIRIIFFRCDRPQDAAMLWPQRGLKTGGSRALGKCRQAIQ